MQAIILAAGQGTRLRPLTNDVPKTMVDLNGQPILWWILNSLPEKVSEIILITGYHGNAIKETFGTEFDRRPIKYIHQTELNGTAGALWKAKANIGAEPFLVLHGDNIYTKNDLEKLVELPLALGIYKEIRPGVKIVFDTGSEGYLTGSHQPTSEELSAPIGVCAGSYMLDSRIFELEPIAIPSGEIGLPQTILSLAKQKSVRLFEHQAWHEINTLNDLESARSSISGIA